MLVVDWAKVKSPWKFLFPLLISKGFVVVRSGQRCTAIKVICVMESVAEELVQKIVQRISKLKVGMPEDNCDITPVVSQSSANFIQGLVEDAQKKGAKFHQVCSYFNNATIHSPGPILQTVPY